MESAETRFAHLLQPIRELAKNWDVDVASELNDYLEEVRFCGGDRKRWRRDTKTLPLRLCSWTRCASPSTEESFA